MAVEITSRQTWLTQSAVERDPRLKTSYSMVVVEERGRQRRRSVAQVVFG